MTNGTMYDGETTAGAARPGPGCPTSSLLVRTTVPSIGFPWHAVEERVHPVLATDRPTRRPSERSP
jgi:hypothetical protein